MTSGEDWDLARKITTMKREEDEIHNEEFQSIMIFLLLLQQLSTGEIYLPEFIDEIVEGMRLSAMDDWLLTCNMSIAYDTIRKNPVLKRIFKDILLYFIDLFEKEHKTDFDRHFAVTKQWIFEN